MMWGHANRSRHLMIMTEAAQAGDRYWQFNSLMLGSQVADDVRGYTIAACRWEIRARELVRECGCDRDLWPQQVQTIIGGKP